MAMSVDEPFDVQIVVRNERIKFVSFEFLVTAWVHDDSLFGFVIENIGVLLKGIKCKALNLYHNTGYKSSKFEHDLRLYHSWPGIGWICLVF